MTKPNRADEIERAATELIDAQDAVYVTRWDQSRRDGDLDAAVRRVTDAREAWKAALALPRDPEPSEAQVEAGYVAFIDSMNGGGSYLASVVACLRAAAEAGR